MTPTDILTHARARIVGPYVPAKLEWLAGWCGPTERLDTFRNPAGVWTVGAYGAGGMANGLPAKHIRLDLRRPEVRDRLVRCGAPEWARDVAQALWVWATTGKVPTMLGRPHGSYRYAAVGEVLSAYRLAPATRGWEVFVGGAFTEGPETGPEGMACADVAALRAGCILAEPDGWMVPLPDGGIGFWPREAP